MQPEGGSSEPPFLYPLIDAWKAFHGYPAQIPLTSQPPWACPFHKHSIQEELLPGGP